MLVKITPWFMFILSVLVLANDLYPHMSDYDVVFAAIAAASLLWIMIMLSLSGRGGEKIQYAEEPQQAKGKKGREPQYQPPYPPQYQGQQHPSPIIVVAPPPQAPNYVPSNAPPPEPQGPQYTDLPPGNYELLSPKRRN